MNKNYLFLFLLFISTTGFSQELNSINWNGYEISYIGETSFDTGMDGKDVNSKLQIRNVSNSSPTPIYFQLYIEGLQAEDPNRDTHGDGGFAVFPNGGALFIEQGETAYTQSWLSGVYEGRFGNLPPVLNQTKAYNFHFLFSESGDKLNASGFPKDATLVADLPVALEFTNSENAIDISNGDLSIEIEVTTDDTYPFSLEISTELKGFMGTNLFNTIQVQGGDGASTPYIFRAHVMNREDWLVKIAKPGKKTEIISVDPDNPNISVTLSQNMQGISPYDLTLLASVNTATGFWRGAVSESEGSFLAVPGMENWSGTSSPKTASKIYKYSFDGNLIWDFDLGWESWGADMSEDGKIVAVASNHPEGSGLYNPSGGEYLLIIDGETGNLLTNLPGIETKSLKLSPNGSFLAIGTQQGTFHIYNIANHMMHMNLGGSNIHGQVREMLWTSDNSSLYVSTGDGYLRKYSLDLSETPSSTNIWTAYAGGWSFINGLNLSDDFNYISTGTKAKSQTVFDTSDGTILWSKHTGSFDSEISTDASRLITFGGKIFDLISGEFTGYLGRMATSHFFHTSDFIIAVDRVTQQEGQFQNGITIHSSEGDQLSNTLGIDRFYDINDLSNSGGEQVQWSYLSADDSRLIVLSRDMDTPFEVGISIFFIVNNGEEPLAIDEASSFSELLSLYPNPSQGMLTFSFKNDFIENIQAIEIIDINGRIMKNIQQFENHQTIDINDLDAGIYIIRIQTLKTNYSTKIIKE